MHRVTAVPHLVYDILRDCINFVNTMLALFIQCVTSSNSCFHSIMHIHILYAGTCERLTDSPAFLVASELLQTTAMTIDEGTITVEEVRVITTEAHIQQNLEQMLGFQSRDKECIAQTVKKLQIAKSRLATFEKERSQLISLLRKWRRHIEPMNQSKFALQL